MVKGLVQLCTASSSLGFIMLQLWEKLESWATCLISLSLSVLTCSIVVIVWGLNETTCSVAHGKGLIYVRSLYSHFLRCQGEWLVPSCPLCQVGRKQALAVCPHCLYLGAQRRAGDNEAQRVYLKWHQEKLLDTETCARESPWLDTISILFLSSITWLFKVQEKSQNMLFCLYRWDL